MVGESDHLAPALASPLTLRTSQIIADPGIRPVNGPARILILFGRRLEVKRFGPGDELQMSEPQGQRASTLPENGAVREREPRAFGLKAEVAREGAFETQPQRRVNDGPGSRGRVRRECSIAVWRKIFYLV